VLKPYFFFSARAAQALEEKEELLLGLPSKCQPILAAGRVYLHSLMAAEHDVRGYAEDALGVLSKVNIVETLNPSARGFRALRIKPKNELNNCY
jgi:hypothetical protein